MRIKCLEVDQPLGTFYIAAVSSDLLKDVTYSRATEIDGMNLTGNQRGLDDDRVREITNYLETNNAAIPNSVILAVNYYEDDSLEAEPTKAWSLIQNEEGLFIDIPDDKAKLAAIVDGQHRINGFLKSKIKMDIPCSIYFELPPSLQALIFATINFNQKKVDKSLAYQLFGYQLDESESDYWSPDIVAVKLSREFNLQEGSPFQNRIELVKKVKPKNESQENNQPVEGWSISSASFIAGVTSLITGNAKADRYEIGKKKLLGNSTRLDLKPNEKYPLRSYYLNGNDLAIKMVVERYFESMSNTLWSNKNDDDIVFRTIGITAQFDFLRELLLKNSVILGKDLNFDTALNDFSGISFDNEYFSPRTATKSRLLNVFRLKAGLINREEVDSQIVEAAGMD
jgi:DNA phosphorothioation-associated DGQHR protein 1